MDILQMLESIVRGPWLCMILAAAATLFVLLYDGGGPVQRTAQEARNLKKVPESAVKQARQLVKEDKPLKAVQLLTEVAGISKVDAHTYVKAYQAAEQGHLSFGEALTVELACDVKAHMDKSEREQAVQLLVTRAQAPQAEAVRLVELMAATRSHRGWLSGKPLPETDAEGDLKKVDALVAEGNKIEAIKLYRKITGASLKEAKEYVDSRSAQ
jgi:ribosomal protein L7/L12